MISVGFNVLSDIKLLKIKMLTEHEIVNLMRV